MKNYIYRERKFENRYGVALRWKRTKKIFGYKVPAISSIQAHLGKQSWYVFLPFWSIKSIVDRKGMVTVAQSDQGQAQSIKAMPSYLMRLTKEKDMKPLGNTKQNALSRKQEKAMRKAGKAKSRQKSKKQMRDWK